MPTSALTFLSHVVKHDGKLELFDRDKILAALLRVGEDTCEYGQEEATEMALQVAMHRVMLQARKAPHVEQIEDIIESVLFAAGYRHALRAYVVDRERRKRLRSARDCQAEGECVMGEWLAQHGLCAYTTVSTGTSPDQLASRLSGKMAAEYWLEHVYPTEAVRAHHDADIHLHHLDTLGGYCASWSSAALLEQGLNGIRGIPDSAPPKHMASAIGQLAQFLEAMLGEWAGSQALSGFDTAMAAFVRKDGLSHAAVRQHMQDFIHRVNGPAWQRSSPAPVSLTFDWSCPEPLRGQSPVIAGSRMPFTYGELQAEMDLLNQAFIDVMMEGDSRGRAFHTPVPTYNITDSFDWNGPNADRLFEMALRYGLPYFQNFVNPEQRPGMFSSMHYRLEYEPRAVPGRTETHRPSAGLTGSIGMVAINGARLGYLHRGDEDGFFAHLDRHLELARHCLETRRMFIQRHIHNGLLPCTRRYLGSLRRYFSVIGVSGINDTIRNITGGRHDMSTPEGEAFGVRIRDHVRTRLLEFQSQTGHLYHLEAALPGEAVSRFALEDRRRYPDILQAGSPDLPQYANAPQPLHVFHDHPVKEMESPAAAPRKYVGGTVLHLCMGEAGTSRDACRALVRDALKRLRLPMIAVAPGSPDCSRHGCLRSGHAFEFDGALASPCAGCALRPAAQETDTPPDRSPA